MADTVGFNHVRSVPYNSLPGTSSSTSTLLLPSSLRLFCFPSFSLMPQRMHASLSRNVLAQSHPGRISHTVEESDVPVVLLCTTEHAKGRY